MNAQDEIARLESERDRDDYEMAGLRAQVEAAREDERAQVQSRLDDVLAFLQGKGGWDNHPGEQCDVTHTACYVVRNLMNATIDPEWLPKMRRVAENAETRASR